MTPTEKLLKMLPKEHHYKVDSLEREYDLIDNCKYLLYFIEDYGIGGEAGSLPVFSIKEAAKFVKEAEYIAPR